MMKTVNEKELQSIQGGAEHYHWKCKVNGYESAVYSSFTSAGKGADNHIKNYPSHFSKTSVITCKKSKH